MSLFGCSLSSHCIISLFRISISFQTFLFLTLISKNWNNTHHVLLYTSLCLDDPFKVMITVTLPRILGVNLKFISDSSYFYPKSSQLQSILYSVESSAPMFSSLFAFPSFGTLNSTLSHNSMLKSWDDHFSQWYKS